ncbi:hypothetical protein OUZ56_014512 [Daphnia magna]|uniref:C2H2-type domain-containing protein n=1 Tax=Daphnia magna TaxID=35525 RepID=A0ABR0AK01_9CRUS|nr:hypothetical protein OUZ56_014512 [Daphnia magna]
MVQLNKTAQLTFECRVCLNTYQSKRELNSHLHAAQHLRSLSRATLPENDQHFPSRKRVFLGFSCKVCSHQFETHSELRKHLSDFDHHWTPKRSREMSNQDRNSYKHENNLRRHRHQSSTDVRSDKSLDWPNRDLFDAENERAKSSLSLRSYGSTDLILDTPVTMLEKNARILNDGIYNSRTEKTYEVNVKVHKHSSNYETDNDPSFITSPDNSVLLQSKVSIEVSSMSESHKGVAVIPTESATRTKDPRQNFLCSRSDAVRRQPKIQNTSASQTTLEGWRLTILSTIGLTEELLYPIDPTEKYDFVLTARWNQDPLERLFGQIRAFDTHPTATSFLHIILMMSLYTPAKTMLRNANVENDACYQKKKLVFKKVSNSELQRM